MEIGIKTLRKLLQKKYREKFSLCILAGEKIIADNAGRIVKVFNQNGLSKELLNAIVDLENYRGQIAVAKIPAPAAAAAPFLVLDNIQDAGNMGAILRSAAAFNYRTIYCVNCADPYSPKVVRASSGMSLQLNIIACGYADLPNNTLYIADMNGENLQNTSPPDSNFGIVLGNEGRGVSPEIYKLRNTAVVSIPMQPACESLNVAVAGGIIMYLLNYKTAI
jgi:TrmH family RNA methyltransferase